MVATCSFASSKEEQKAALSELFNGPNDSEEQTVTAKYGSEFVSLVSERVGDLTDYKGLDCRAEVSLFSNGSVEKVTLSNQNILCRKVFNTVWDIGSFSLPNNITESNKLRKFRLYISP
nr:cell envelope integrity protein TolA [Vibrio plantisponsor]